MPKIVDAKFTVITGPRRPLMVRLGLWSGWRAELGFVIRLALVLPFFFVGVVVVTALFAAIMR